MAAGRARDGRPADHSWATAARARAESAVRELVRTAWLVHVTVDGGTLEQMHDALTQLRAAVDDAPAALGRGAR